MVSVLRPSALDLPPMSDYPSCYAPPPPLPLQLSQPPPPAKFHREPVSLTRYNTAAAAASMSTSFYVPGKATKPQRSNSTAAALHLRSQSVPEAVYLEQQQQHGQQVGLPLPLPPQPLVLQRASPTKQFRVMHFHGHPPPPPPPPPAVPGLRRSHTNATEFAASRRRFQSGAARLGVSSSCYAARQFGSNQHLNLECGAGAALNTFFPPPPPLPPPPPVPLPGHLAGFQPEETARGHLHQRHPLSRSRSNAASLRPQPPPPPQPSFHLHHNPLYTRSTSHLFHRGSPPAASAQFAASSLGGGGGGCGSLQMLLLQQPLHVDCSIEYDLGKQPLIPAGSEPLLIVDPAYAAAAAERRQERQEARLRSASSAPLSPSSPRPFAEGVVAPSRMSTPKKGAAAAGRRASFLETAADVNNLRRPKGMSVQEENEGDDDDDEGEEEGELTTTGGHRQQQQNLQRRGQPQQQQQQRTAGFHLSMPEIAVPAGDDDGDRDQSGCRGRGHHRRRHHHHHHRRCRTDTAAASRKVSSESSSGMDSGAGSTSSMFQKFSQLRSRSQVCDSGLGTPSSQSVLKPTSSASAASVSASRAAAEEEAIQVIQLMRHQLQEGRSAAAPAPAVTGNANQRSRQWKSSVTGK